MDEHNDNDELKYTFYIDGIKVTVSGLWQDRERIKSMARKIMGEG